MAGGFTCSQTSPHVAWCCLGESAAESCTCPGPVLDSQRVEHPDGSVCCHHELLPALM